MTLRRISPIRFICHLLNITLVFSSLSFLQTQTTWNNAGAQNAPSYADLVTAGNNAMKADKLQDALAAAMAAIDVNKDRFEAYALATLVLQRQGDVTQAKSLLEKALAVAPESKRAQLRQIGESLDKATPNKEAAANKLSRDAIRKQNVLLLIIEDADAAKTANERNRFLNEYLEKSEPFLASNPTAEKVWLLRAAAALELSKTKIGWEAGRKLLSLGANESDDPNTQKVLAKLDRKGWLSETMPSLADKDWENSLGMKFVPVRGTDVLFCIWETRVRDFSAFARTGYNADEGMFSLDSDGWNQRSQTWRDPGFNQTEDHAVVGVSWNDAQAFCRWLTKTERTAGLLDTSQSYRLPTDIEWSSAVGLPRESGDSPKDRDGKIKNAYPWGSQFPPPSGAGNYFGTEAKIGREPQDWPVISGFSDSFPRTAPAGSFSANEFGIFDLGGNVWEWCEDWYDDDQKYRVLRGASWLGGYPAYLLSSFRSGVAPVIRGGNGGFRVVLVGVVAR